MIGGRWVKSQEAVSGRSERDDVMAESRRGADLGEIIGVVGEEGGGNAAHVRDLNFEI